MHDRRKVVDLWVATPRQCITEMPILTAAPSHSQHRNLLPDRPSSSYAGKSRSPPLPSAL